ncbi:MAG: class I SAM-dependent methyltransferase [Candidatus Sumerlaeia bacterium]
MDQTASAPANCLDFGPNVTVENYECPIDVADFENFEARFSPYVRNREKIYRTIPGGSTWPEFEPPREKVLEYYLTVQALDFGPRKEYLDIASCLSLFPNFVAENYPCRVSRQDLFYPAGKHAVAFPRIKGLAIFQRKTRITCLGSDACNLPLDDTSIDLMTMHCSLEHFEGPGDTSFMQEAFRVLKPGGKLMVIPFYCGDQYQEIIKEEFASGCQFHRYYDPEQFVKRIVEPLTYPCVLEMRYYRNSREIDPEFYCDYSVCLRKEDDKSA